MPAPAADGRLLGHFSYPIAREADLVEVGPGHRLHRDAAAALLAMQRDAAADGVQLQLLSAFRNQDTQQHAFRYHFRLSFPADNHQGVAYEPWHWRWEGSSDALELFEQTRRFSAAT